MVAKLFKMKMENLSELTASVDKLNKRQDLLAHELMSMRRRILQQDVWVREQIYKNSKNENLRNTDRLRHRESNH